jgi:hypothetical protein
MPRRPNPMRTEWGTHVRGDTEGQVKQRDALLREKERFEFVPLRDVT